MAGEKRVLIEVGGKDGRLCFVMFYSMHIETCLDGI
jgi:hypothetical protein